MNLQAEAEAPPPPPPEEEIAKHKRQPADMRKCRAGDLGSVPTVREEQRRDPRIPEDPQPQRGPPGRMRRRLQGAKRSLRQRL